MLHGLWPSHFETEKVLGTCTDLLVTIPHALCIEKNIVYYVISFREGRYGFRKPKCGDPENRITLCEINSIKTDNIDGYIINIYSNPPSQKICIISYQQIKNSYHFQLASNFNVFIDRTLQSKYSPMCDHNDISSVSLYVIYNLCCKKKKTKNILWYM